LVLTVGISVQVVPANRFQQVWGAWSAAVTEWEPLAGQSLLDVHYPLPPVAKGAIVDPARIRPLRARYQWNDLKDGKIESTLTVTLELEREGSNWRLRTNFSGDYTFSALLDESLRPLEWVTANRWGTRNQHESIRQYKIWGDSIRVKYQPGLDSSSVRQTTCCKEPYDSTWHYYIRPEVPYAIDQTHLIAMFTTLPIRRGWVGSVYANDFPRFWGYGRQTPTSFLAVGEDSLTTRYGTFTATEVRDLHAGPRPYRRIWINKADGLVVKLETGGPEWGSQLLLESVTYP
jgi:hypothetical protein